jgi:hypothetical protein
VFIGAGEEECIKPTLPHMPADHIGHYRGVQMTKMRQAVGIVDGCCDVKGFGHLPIC